MAARRGALRVLGVSGFGDSGRVSNSVQSLGFRVCRPSTRIRRIWFVLLKVSGLTC